MKRPSKVRIFGRNFAIKYLNEEDMPEYFGLCHTMRQLIQIREGQTPIEEADTVLHEVLHGIARHAGLGMDEEMEEQAVGCLATGLIGVLQDNPEFAKWLIEKRK